MNQASESLLTGKLSSDDAEQDTLLAEQSIGAILAQLRNLTDSHIERILALQRQKGLRFGEAAISLGYVSRDDVLYALAQQFHYPFVPDSESTTSSELVMLAHPFSAQAEAFRGIRSRLVSSVFVETDDNLRALAVVSPASQDGKTFFVANLGVAFAQLGGRTLLVDADLRGPRLHSVMGLQNRSGLSDILSGRKEEKVIQHVSSVPGLFILPAGTTPPNPVELIERPAFALLIRELLSKFDYVLVDTPAAEYGVDAAVVAARCGAALMVARKHRGHVDSLKRLRGMIGDGRCVMAGAVFNEY